ncbi:MAG TPA: RelA/SpoT family protein, partial [Coxiellaceae bacterium]|nr:RelA/SpoT family protein [Coxiellaceae bacterium]
MRLFKRLRRKLEYLSKEEIDKVHQAYLLAFEAHRGQKRRTGEPYITHPVSVACILAEIKLDYQTIMAALLHDVIEDTSVTKENIAQQFGEEVAELVDGVSKLTQIEFVSRAQAQAENLRKMVLAMAKDIRVILVKLADRLHNMRTLESLPPSKQQRIARETLEIFAPVAKRLGMREFSVELEENAFAALHPNRYEILKTAIRKARGNRKKVLALIEKTLKEAIANSKISSQCAVRGREKHIYSIYRKMKVKRIPFNEIMDVYAFRIIVDDIDTCYRVLGIVHNLYKPVPERFKDYVAIPKINGYQSLHTTLFGPYGLPIEIQIRTSDMDKMATSGIAAHWLYKSDESVPNKSQLSAQRWVKSLLELQQNTGSSMEFVESMKVDLFPHEVYVFTPKGRIMELPSGASAVDFAYAVHTDVGNACVAVKIDRQLAPLSSVLENGQTIEVITATGARPNPAWLDFVVTSKARSSIRHFLKTQRHSESVILGRQLLKQSLVKISFNVRHIPPQATDLVVREAELKSWDDLLADIGIGNRAAAVVAQRLVDVVQQLKVQPAEVEQSVEKQEAPILVKGTEGMVVHFASCCHPIPGDPIVGILKAGKGILVHRVSCVRIKNSKQYAEHG